MSTTATAQGHVHGTFLAASFLMEVHECGACGVVYALAKGFADNRRNDHKNWRCPNGDVWSYSSESDEERLRRQLRAANDRAGHLAANLDQTTASLRATKGVVTRQKKKLGRVTNGVCPCCNRSFKDLARHMASKHPNSGGAQA